MLPVARNRQLIRRYIATTVLIVVLLPILAIGAIRSIESMCVAPEKWVPPSFEARQTYDWFVDQFETGDVVIVSWDGCTIDDPRLAKLETIVGETADRAGSGDFSQTVDRIVTGFSAIRTLMDEPLRLSPGEAIDRLSGTLVGPDRRTSCAFIVMTRAGNNRRRETIQQILNVIENECGVAKDQIHTVGPPVNGVAIDDASIYGINLFGNLSIVISALLCWISLRSWFLTLTIVGTGVVGQAAVLAAVYFSGYQLDAILIIIPSLVLVLTVSAGVHLVNYYRDEVRLNGVDGAAQRALSQGAKPCMLSAATTAIGIGSLAISQITPVMMFGVIASLGVLASVGTLLLVLPGAMELFPLKQGFEKGAGAVVRSTRPPFGQCPAVPATALDPFLNHKLGWMYSWLVARPNAIAVVCVVTMLTATIGLPKLTTSVDVVSLFSKRSRLVNDYQWFEKNIGPSVPVEIVLSFGRKCELSAVQRIRLVSKVQDHVNQSAQFAAATSAATLAPKLDSELGLAQRLLSSRILNHRLQRDRQGFIDAHYLSDSEAAQSWRISARTTALGQPDYPRSLRLLKTQVAQIVSSEYPDEKIQVRYTGMMPLASTVQQEVLSDLRHSFLTAVLLVAVVMVIAMRSLAAGLLCMLPNLFPVVLVFGMMGLSGTVINIGMIMTASVALGIAIDDTLHFLTWYRRERSFGVAPADAVHSSIRHCGRAMIQTTLICGLGLLVFSLSDFMPTRQFAFMMCILLVTALIADLIFLPALICGPLGRFFAQSPIAGLVVPTSGWMSVEQPDRAEATRIK